MAQIRLDRFLAEHGAGTRSEVKKILRSGRVAVSGVVETRPERKVEPGNDRITLDGRELLWQPFVCLMLHKPAGCITATEDRRQQTVMDLIDHPRKKELFPVGRLDLDTEGLLLLMNDGALAHRMLSPKHHVEKTYFARVAGEVTGEDVEAFRLGVDIGEKELTLPAKLSILRVTDAHTKRSEADCSESEINREQSNREEERNPEEERTHGTHCEDCKCGAGLSQDGAISEVTLTICEGKFHQVKRMFEARGKKVLYLKRISMAGLGLDDALAPGQWRELTKEEMERLQTLC